MTALTKLKIAVLAPMPRASVITTTAANPGFLRSIRAAYRMSCHKSLSKLLPEAPGVIAEGGVSGFFVIAGTLVLAICGMLLRPGSALKRYGKR